MTAAVCAAPYPCPRLREQSRRGAAAPACAHRHRSGFRLPLAHHQQVGDLLGLTLADLVAELLGEGEEVALAEVLQGGGDLGLMIAAVEAVGAAEAVHHLGLDVTLLGIAGVLGERVVADDRAVLVFSLGGSQVHAYALNVLTL